MIVKLTQDPGFENYALRHSRVRAMKMQEDFMLETSLGFLKGKKGDFIVEVAPHVRYTCTAKVFLTSHARLAPDGCDLRCGRNGKTDCDEGER